MGSNTINYKFAIQPVLGNIFFRRKCMKTSRIILIMLTAAAVLTLLFSCGLFDSLSFSGDIAAPTLTIPGALTSGGARTVSRAASPGGTAEDFFEPFRASLEIGDNILTVVYNIIASINSTYVPDTFEGAGDNGEYISITTDTNRTYSKRIEFKSSESAAAPYMQINYNPNITKGVIYYSEEDSAKDLEKVKVFYDETGTYPVLSVWGSVKDGTDTYPKSFYFHATKNADGKIVVEGGVSYNFVFGSGTTYPVYNTSERTYMYKALCSSDGTKAEVALYFPLSTVTTTAVPETADIKSSFLDVLYNWIEVDNSGDLSSMLGAAVTDGASLGTAIDAYVAADGVLDDSLAFILNLENTIAYSDTNGYEGNANNSTYPFPASFDMGDISTISFSMSPADIAALTSAAAAFTFLSN